MTAHSNFHPHRGDLSTPGVNLADDLSSDTMPTKLLISHNYHNHTGMDRHPSDSLRLQQMHSHISKSDMKKVAESPSKQELMGDVEGKSFFKCCYSRRH